MVMKLLSSNFSRPNNDLFWTPEKSGTTFFKRLILSDPKIKSLVREYWTDFQTVHLDNLKKYIEDYTFIINGAKARNRELWNRELVTDEQVMKQWIENRVSYMNSFINKF